MIPLFLIAHGLHHFCGYEKEISNRNTTIHSEKLISKKSLKGGAQWKNIRIHFDYRYLDGTRTDNQMCTYSHQYIKWQGHGYTCGSEDLLTKAKIDVIKGTFENVRSYLQRLLKVIPLTSSFKVISNQYYLVHTQIDTIYNADLYMAITARPRYQGESTLASAGALATERTFSRPYVGGVYLNPRKIPSSVQSENTKNNEFFYTCVHEIFHALGFSGNLFSTYHPYEDSTPHKNPTCSLTVKGKSMTFLTTPYARKFAKKRYGVTIFYGDSGSSCPAGIEIEDGGGSGTTGSHLEERTFMSEMMTGVTIQTENGPFSRLTDASLAVLQDTGNYKCDYKMAQPLVWGHPESIDGKHIPNFGTGPWQLVFPEGYVYNKTYQYYTGFDYKFFGPATTAITPYCSYYSNDLYCKGKNFFNPTNGDIGTNPTFDYMPFKFPNNVCEKDKALILSTSSYNGQKCGEYVCNSYTSFTWRHYNKPQDPSSYETFICNKSNVGEFFESNIKIDRWRYFPRKLACPDPERFCRTMKLYDAHFEHDPFNENYKVLEPYNGPPEPTEQPDNAGGSEPTEQPDNAGGFENKSTSTGGDDLNSPKNTDSGKKKNEWLKYVYIALGVACAIVIIVVVAIVIYKCHNKQADNEDGSEEDPPVVFVV